jgi:hypothetical protein
MTEFEAQSIRMTIDHYEPRNSRKDLEHDYQNLMYACGICNERKGDLSPPDIARQQGHRFFRADQDIRSDHFDVQGGEISGKTSLGEFNIKYLDLDREGLVKLRDIRERMTKCLPLVAEGVMALRAFPIDTLPSYVRTKVISHVNKTTDMAMTMDSQVDEILLGFAKSEMIDPDETSAERASARKAYTEGLNAMYPGSAFRAPRRRKG